MYFYVNSEAARFIDTRLLAGRTIMSQTIRQTGSQQPFVLLRMYQNRVRLAIGYIYPVALTLNPL